MVLKTLPTDNLRIEPHELKADPHWLAPLLGDVFRYTRPERILDPTAGSGVTAAAAGDELIPCVSYDMHDLEAGKDLFTIDEPNGFDLVVYHPDLWRSRSESDHPHDLGATMSWDAYVELNRDAIVHLAQQLRPGGHLFLVAPIARFQNIVYDLARDLQCLLGAPKEPLIIHPHPSCRSRGNMYGKRFIPIAHDHALLWGRQEILEGAGLVEADTPTVFA